MKFYSKFSKMFFSLLMVLFLMASAVSPALAQTGGTDEQSSQQPVTVMPQAGQVAGAGVTYNPDTVYVTAVWSDASVHFLDENLADQGSFPIGDSSPNGIAADGLVIYTGHFSTQSVRAFDYSGNFLFSWTDSRLAGLQGLELVNGELAVFSGSTNEVHFFTTNGSYIRSIPGQGYTTEGLAFDGNLLWSLADSLVGVDPVSGASIFTIPNAASGCAWGGSGLTASAPGVLTLACENGNWFHVSSLDGAVLASGNNGLNMYGLKYAPIPLPDAEDDGTLFYEDFENGYADWTFDSLWNPENEADTCGSLVAPFPSPTNAMYFGQDGVCNYATGNLTGTLTLNTPISLPVDISPSLTFGSYENTEGACGQYDRRFVEVSTDGGGNWDTLGEMCNEDAWYQAGFDLSAYAGQSVLLRFHFITGDDFLNEYFGWMVDDVLVNYSPMPFVTDEDTLLVTPSVLDNDSDPDGNPLFLESYDTSGLMGGLSYNGDGTFTYNPVGAFDYLPHGAQAEESFTYVVSNTMYTDTASVFILVTGVDDVPVGVEDYYSTPEDTDLNIAAPGVLDNDYDPEGDPIVAELVSGPALGNLSFNADGSFDYTPAPDYHGVVTFTYAVTNSQFLAVNSLFTVGFDEPEFPLDSPVDGHVVTSLDGVSIPPLSFGFEILGSPSLSATFTTIGPGETMFNSPPNIEGPNDGTLSVDFGENVDYAGFGFVVGCLPTVSNAVTVTAYAADMSPLGTFYADGIDGGFSFAENWLDITPGMPFRSLAIDFVDYCFGFTVDNLTYGANLGSTLVTIEVTPENDAPVADDQVITTTEDTAYVGLLTASDLDGDLLSFGLDTAPVNGSAEIDADGVFTYTPDADFNGADSFTFSASDGSLSDLGQVTVTVTPENDAPVADDQVITTTEDTAYVGLLTASDADGDLLSFGLDTAPVNGSVEIDADGVFTYTPDADFNGADSFTFSASDGSLSDLGQVNVTVTPENDAPVADDQVITTTEDTAYVGLLTASDLDGDLLSFGLDTAPVNGSVEIDADGVFTYTPNADFNGADFFTISVSDGSLSDLGQVNVTVTPENDAPVADDQVIITAEDTAYLGLLTASDVDGDLLIFSLDTAPVNGSLEIAADGVFTYTPDLDYFGTDSFTFGVSDSELSDLGNVHVTVTPENGAPVVDAGEDQLADEGALVSFSGSYSLGGLLGVQAVEIAWDFGDGTTASGTLTPTHTYVEDGNYTVTLVITDDLGGVGMDSLLVSVANVAPVISAITDRNVQVGEAFTVTASLNDPGLEDLLVLDVDWGDGQTGSFDLQPGPQILPLSHAYAAVGSFTVTVTVTDDDGGFDEITFMVNVTQDEVIYFHYYPFITK